MPPDDPTIWVLGTGGTIAGVSTAGAPGCYKAAQTSVHELVGRLGLKPVSMDIRCEQVMNVSSQAMVPADWHLIGRRVSSLATIESTHGIVVLSGTDTMEELAYFLHIVVRTHKPVVVIGAMRPGETLGCDGPANLRDAIALAATQDAGGLGVLIVMNGVVMGARDVRKANTADLASVRACRSPNLAYMAEGHVQWSGRRASRHTFASEFDIDSLTTLPAVDLLYGYAGDNSHLVAASVRAGAAGIVYAGVGNGNMHPKVHEALETATCTGIAVVRASRTCCGRVGPEGEIDSAVSRLMVAYDLPPPKARVLLMVGLAAAVPPEMLQSLFRTY